MESEEGGMIDKYELPEIMAAIGERFDTSVLATEDFGKINTEWAEDIVAEVLKEWLER